MRILIAALGALAVSLSAEAAPATCPADAEQRLYDMTLSIQRGEQTEAKPVAELAGWAVNTCPDRSHAQALAATLLGAVIPSASSTETMTAYIALADKAVTQNDYSWTPKLGGIALKNADGTETQYFGYNIATGVLTGKILPYAAALAEKGTTPALLSGKPFATCPFADHSGWRLENEASLWNNGVKTKWDQPVFALAEARLKSLHASCPAHRADLDFYLARLYGQEAERLSRWVHDYNENPTLAHDGWFWRNPTTPETFSSDRDMQKKKAELDALARPLAAKAKPYLDAYFSRPASRASDTDENHRDAVTWRKAVEALTSAP